MRSQVEVRYGAARRGHFGIGSRLEERNL